MKLETTTSDPVSEPNDGDIDSQANEQEQVEAVVSDEVTSQTSESEESESPEVDETEADDSEDTELKDWAAKKNLPLDDPLKLAKMYRESEQKLGKKGQQQGQLKDAVTSANSESSVEDVQALRNEMQALTFYVNHPEAKQFEPAMVSILEEKPWLGSDLDSVLDIAKGRATTTNLVAERQAGKKEALAQAETASRAAPPRASATQPGYSSNKITFDNVDELIARNGHQWFKDHKDEINRVLAG